MKRRCLALGASLAALVLGPTGSALASSDATQSAGNSASADSANLAQTGQAAGQAQQSSSSCTDGCGGSGQSYKLGQESSTAQAALGFANAKQNGVNANVPVVISGGKVSGGDSSATQSLNNPADADATNKATTNQAAGQKQSTSSLCKSGCGGTGQSQKLGQQSSTKQLAVSKADADQNGVNANVPVVISGGKVSGGDSSASQRNSNSADADATNKATTDQAAGQSQDSRSACDYGCGGSGQSQKLGQESSTKQLAASKGNAKQNALNLNAGVRVDYGKKPTDKGKGRDKGKDRPKEHGKDKGKEPRKEKGKNKGKERRKEHGKGRAKGKDKRKNGRKGKEVTPAA